MKNLMLGIFIAGVSLSATADPVKGQKYYLKYLRPLFNYNGQVFAQQQLQREWEGYFEKGGQKFIKKFSEKHPESAEFLASKKFQKIVPHIKDFAVKYAADSGELPNCN
jgi:hypothetical protein